MNNRTDAGEKYLNGRDLLRRLEVLLDEREDAKESSAAELAQWDEENSEELAALDAIENEVSGDSELILDSAFDEYARELAESTHGTAIQDASWPFNCIDWERAIEELQQDYGSIEYGGYTYWVRS